MSIVFHRIQIHHFTDSESPKVSRPNGSGSKTGAGTGTGQGSDGSSSFTLNQCLAEYTREVRHSVSVSVSQVVVEVRRMEGVS